MQGGLAPVLMTKNDKSEVGRHSRGTAVFNEFSARVWEFAGLKRQEKPILKVLEGDPEEYERSSKEAVDGVSIIPVYHDDRQPEGA